MGIRYISRDTEDRVTLSFDPQVPFLGIPAAENEECWAVVDPPTHLVDETTGARIDPVLVDRATGTPLEDLHVRAVGRVTEGITERNADRAL